MKKLLNYKRSLFVTMALILCFGAIMCNSEKVAAVNRAVDNSGIAPASYKLLSWSLGSRAKKYSSAVYVEAGGSIKITVIPSPSSSDYRVGIQQPSGSEREMEKTSTTTTTYAIPFSGNYKVFVQNLQYRTVSYDIAYVY